MLSIAEVLQRPLFKCASIVAGHNGIGRTIGWVHIVDIKNAGLYINRDDLILSTGLGLAGTNEKEREDYLQELIHHGVAGLCIELGDYFSQLPSDMLSVANRHDFPLIVFTERVRFVEITQDIHSLLVNSQLESLQNLAAFSHDLQRMTLRATDVRPIVSALHRHTSHQVVYYSPSGESLSIPNSSLAEAKKTLTLYKEALTKDPLSSQQAGVLQLDMRHFILSQPIISLGQTVSYIGLVISGEKISESLLMSLDYAAKSVTNFLLRRMLLEEKRREGQDRFLRELLEGTVTDEEQAQEQIGPFFPTSGPFACIAGIATLHHTLLRYEGDSIEPNDDIILLVRSLLQKQSLQALLMLEGTKLYILCLFSRKYDTAFIKKRLQAFIVQFEQSLLHMFGGDTHITIGFGQVKTRIMEGKESFEEAEETLKINQTLSGRPFYEDLGIYQLVPRFNSKERMSSFITGHIGALLEYDRDYNAQLLETLRVYLKHMGSKQSTAQELFIHRQTLYHRLEKCRDLLGEDYLTQDKRLCIEAALLLHELLKKKQ
ncbi:PucR family transcriptional regulator [Aneurinibacillus migulanus]|uniref:PucR family transcriptional regulator n=1 Tax=Aneurinibacillus migulanus TaxID=47500 RepID=UPI00209E927C|nr:PucR family transcriptional regulator [Aneurinibacillus migulanus]MCP1355743.1 PucR family transcriptional regulator ligand-binding domain-containing protein [Aneurinibacillus migulanus]